ncbi:MAG: GreA/GreB family elongation factor [Planctomycetota bacterium]|jgi:transcription elongation factor GreA
MEPSTEAAAALRKLAKNRKFDELETACVEAIESDGVDREELLSALRLAAHRASPDQVESLTWLVLTSYAERHGPEEGLALAGAASDVLPDSGMIREEIAGFAKAAHGIYPGLEDLLDRTVLAADLPLGKSVPIVASLLRLAPGTYVRERGHKAPGRVVGLVDDGATLEVDLGDRRTTYALARAEVLHVLEPDHFHALKVFERERLAALAEEDPARLVEKLLGAQGRTLSYRDLRAALVDVVPDPWTGWWNEARPRIRRSPWIDVSAGNQPTLTLRRAPLSHEERVRRDFDAADSELDRLTSVLDYLEQSGNHLGDEQDVVRTFAKALDGLAREGDAALALGAAAVLEEVRRAAPEAVPGEPPPLAEGGGDEMLRPFADPRLERLALGLVRERRPESWPEFFEQALSACSAETCEAAARELAANGDHDALARVSETVLEHPGRSTGALLWLFKSFGAGGPVPTEGPECSRLLVHLLAALDRESRAPGGKGPLYNKVRNALTAKNYAQVRVVLLASDLDGAKRVKAAVDRCLGLTETARARLGDVLSETHPELFASDLMPWERDDVIFTTARGLERKHAEYERLVNERLPEIAKQIGKAASFGDLSENAEYTAALEERERLTERANSLHAELGKAQEIPRELAEGDSVNVGSAVRVRDLESGREARFVFLGPWDGDMEQGIYYYRAPFARAFMGRKAGDTTVVTRGSEEERWEITSVESGISSAG